MLRTTQQHHATLSSMADQKANILIGVSLLMLTLLYTKMLVDGFSAALLVLTVFTLAAAVLALSAVTPSLKTAAPNEAAFNPLFFGHFATIDVEDYMDHMRSLMQSDEEVYEAMIRDIYQLGLVLYRRKYRYLTYSYRVFVVGLVATFLVLIVEVQVYGGGISSPLFTG